MIHIIHCHLWGDHSHQDGHVSSRDGVDHSRLLCVDWRWPFPKPCQHNRAPSPALKFAAVVVETRLVLMSQCGLHLNVRARRVGSLRSSVCISWSISVTVLVWTKFASHHEWNFNWRSRNTSELKKTWPKTNQTSLLSVSVMFKTDPPNKQHQISPCLVV